MTAMYHNSRLQITDGKLKYLTPSDETAYKLFLQTLPEGTQVELYVSVEKDDASVAQIKKIHAMIRELSIHTGYSMSEMKIMVKDKAGLVVKTTDAVHTKSFAICSKEELALAIEAAKEIGDSVNCVLQ